MKRVIGAVALGLTILPTAALAQGSKSDASSAPSAQNSGAGIPGHPGSKSGPAVKPGTTVGSGSAEEQQNLTVRSQDPSKVKGLPGNKSGLPDQQHRK